MGQIYLWVMKISSTRLREHPNVLAAVHPSDLEKLQKLKYDTVYSIEVKEERNPKFNSKFFALLRLTLDNMPEHIKIENTEQLKEHLKIRLGHYEIIQLHETGKEIIKTKSISFSKMDELKFKDFYDRAVDEMLRHYLKGLTPEKVEEMIYYYL